MAGMFMGSRNGGPSLAASGVCRGGGRFPCVMHLCLTAKTLPLSFAGRKRRFCLPTSWALTGATCAPRTHCSSNFTLGLMAEAEASCRHGSQIGLFLCFFRFQ